MTTTTLFANPYNIDANGFYFTNSGDFIAKMDGLTDRWGAPVEEFEIDFIDGDDSQLFNVCGINQANLETWGDIEMLEEGQKTALFYLLTNGYDLDDAINKIDDVMLFQGHLIDAATELFNECYAHQIPDNLKTYIDYEAFAHDCQINGDMCEFEYKGETWTCTNAND